MSSQDDWFRSDAWDSEAREQFETKLGRARSSRAQYLRIKGLTLVHTGDPLRVDAGRELLGRVLAEHPDDAMECAGAHYELGMSSAAGESWDQAEVHLRECLALEAGRHFSHGTELALAEVVVASGKQSGLSEATRLLDIAADSSLLFHSQSWRLETTRARLEATRGNDKAAARHAASALDLLDDNQPQLPRHPDVGLIDPERETVAEMRRLAGRRRRLFPGSARR